MELVYYGATFGGEALGALLSICLQYKILPSYAITLQHYESMWGTSEVAKLNNNLGGMSWDGITVRKSGVVVSRGSKRPAREGGYYIKYNSWNDYFKDWGFLLRPGGIYKVSGQKTFGQSVKGMFRVGGAQADYATMNVSSSQERFNKYYRNMQARHDAINQANDRVLSELDRLYLSSQLDEVIDSNKGVNLVSNQVSAKAVLDKSKSYMGVVKGSPQHKQILSTYNDHVPLARGTRMQPSWEWCACFVSAMGIATGQSDIISIREISVEQMKNKAKSIGIWKGRTKPQVGDIIIFSWDGSSWADHVGFVEKVNGNMVATIEGNTGYPNGSYVGRNTFAYNDNRIQGYIRPRYGSSGSTVAPSGGDGQRRFVERHFEVEVNKLRVFTQPKGDLVHLTDTLTKGEIKNIDQTIYINGYKWVSYVKYSGERVYTTWQTIDGKRQFGELRDGLIELNDKVVRDDKDSKLEVGEHRSEKVKLKENEFLGYDGVIYVVTKKEK